MSPISQDILDGLPHEFSVKLEDIRMTPAEFDAFCSSEPHVVRSLKGHCFEAWFDDLLTRAGYHCEEIGGDSLFDRRVNGKTLQLKTPYQRGTVDGVKVSYRMHKTHGPERFPDVLYRREDFADFLVGHRRGNDVLICPAANMPLKKEVQKKSPWPDYIADPTPFNWNCEWVNRYDLIGVDAKRISADESGDSLFFPAIARAVGFNDVYIVKAILNPRNFRVWQQNIVGSVREFHFKKWLTGQGFRLQTPAEARLDYRSRNKVDLICFRSGSIEGARIQVKGLTKSLCKGNIAGVETKNSHGRPPLRLYRRTDFDYLAVVVDPGVIPSLIATAKSVDQAAYNFVLVSARDLPLHPRSSMWASQFPGVEFLDDKYRFDLSRANFNDLSAL